jgi:RHS repeat-associated protein
MSRETNMRLRAENRERRRVGLLSFQRSGMLALGLSLLCFSSPAADKSGVSPNSISLPKGPGSIEGLGESFQPSLNTGTAKYGIGLKLPPGTAGHQPELKLTYDGGGGNGPLGYGWNLSLPSVQRRTDKGIPTYGASVGFARTDILINDTKEELVPQSNGFWFCKNESSFVRYRQVSNHWEGTLPDGTKLEFGVTPSGRIEEGARTFCWLLERETDTRGNVIEYGYQSFAGGQNLNQKYLASVRYGPGAPPWSRFHFASFQYEDRPDWFEDARAGFMVRTGKRLKRILIGSQGVALTNHLAGDFNGDGTVDYLNRRYDLDYLRYAGDASHWSLLSKVTLVGADGVTALPPMTLSYAVSNPPDQISAQNAILGGIDEPTAVMDSEFVDLVDLNADGLPDILRTEVGGGAHTVFVNRGPVEHNGGKAIQWGVAMAVDPGAGTAWNFDLASDRTHLADMNGDGLADLVHKSLDNTVFFFANGARLNWSERLEMSAQDSAPPAPFGANDVRTADIDFDKRIDVIQSIDIGGSVAYRVWFNLGGQAYSSPITVEPIAGYDFSVAGVQIADCNGDRVPDIARVQSGAMNVLAGLGYGQFAPPQALVIPDTTLDDQQIGRAKLTDVNGDGLADLVLERAAPGSCWYWLNLGNYTLSSRKTITGLPALDADAAVRWADLNGNGTTDLIYADSGATPRIQAIEIGELLTGGLSPNTLVEIRNGIGRVIRIDYAPSTQFALEDLAAGNPWPDNLPFPVTVVSRVAVSDSLGHEYVTEFRYHDGYYDSVEKQFRGFATVEELELGDPAAPTLVSRSRFDTGRNFEAMKGKLLRMTKETETGEVFSDENTLWANPPRTLMTGTNGQPVHFAHPTGSTKDILERGQGTPRRTETETEFDNYGNQTRMADYGIVEGANRSAFDDERITIAQFAVNPALWIIRKPMRKETRDENGGIISRTDSFYDDETFAGNNFGSVSIGNLTLQRVWISPSNSAAFVKFARTRYDSHGNPVAVLDALADGTPNQGHFRELSYDSPFRTYPIRETVHVGAGKPPLVFEASYDSGLAALTSATDFNSHVTTFGYDALSRLTKIIRPGDSEGFPTTEYEYALAVPAAATGIVNYVETRLLDKAPGTAGAKRNHYLLSRQFVDGLGRQLMKKDEADPEGGNPRVAVTGAVLFNAREKLSRALNPFFSVQGATLESLLAYEDISAPGWLGAFHFDGGMVHLNLATAHQTAMVYDATLRDVHTTNQDGTSGRTVYEPLVTKIFDENDSDPASPHFDTPEVNYSDGLGRLVRVDEIVRLNDDGTPSGTLNTWTTRYEYDLNDCLTRITDSQNNVKLMRYDGMKRKTFMNDPDSGVTTNVYDEASNLISTTDAKGQRITFAYDGLNRLLAEDFRDETSPDFRYNRTPDIEYFYDLPAASVGHGDGTSSTARNTRGLLAYVSDASGEEHMSYDHRGRMEWMVKRVREPGLTGLVPYTTRLEYDVMDRIVRLVYPDNDQITYRYNDRNLVQSIGGGPSGNIISSIGYLPSMQQGQITYGNGVETRYRYDARQRLINLLTSNPGAQLINFAFGFDAGSNVKSIQDQRPASAIPGSANRRNTQTFVYDDLYRLTRVHYNPASLDAQSTSNAIGYRYDRIGNMLAQTSDIAHFENGASVTDLGTLSYGGAGGRHNRMGRQANDPPGPHALTSITPGSTNQARTFEYDAHGSMTHIDGLECTWDFRDRLVAVEDETMRAEYTYDYSDRRVTKRVTSKITPENPNPAPPTSVIYVSKNFEVREHGQPTKYVFNGPTRVAHITGSLSSNIRVQQLRVSSGWNLVSLAVTASNLLAQLQEPVAVVQAVYRWNPATSDYSVVTAGQTVASNSVLWIKAATNAVLTVSGPYADPVNRQIPSGGAYIAGPGLETWNLDEAIPPSLTAWSHSSPEGRWQSKLRDDLEGEGDLPHVLAPGHAIFVEASTMTTLDAPEAALRVRYYHQDHLGSSSAMTDAIGELVEETAFYPFGLPRNEYRLRAVEEHYKFTQKERDRESGLHYFEARFLAACVSRFISPDPKFLNPDRLTGDDLTDFLRRPGKGNLYAYVLNNPLRYSDPTGLDKVDDVGWGNDLAGIFVGVLGEFDTFEKSVPVKALGGVSTAISVGIKGYQLAKDPSAQNGAQFAWEVEKAAVSFAFPPVGLVLAAMDLAGVGPSAWLQEMDQIIAGHKYMTKLYKETAENANRTAKIYNDGAKRIAPKLEALRPKVAQLEKAVAKYVQQVSREHQSNLAEIRRLEKQIRYYKKVERYWKERERKANEE